MGLIDKSAILAAQDIKSEDIDMPEWGGTVRVRELSAADLLGFWDFCRDENGEVVRARVQSALLVRAVVGEDGAPLFTDADVDGLMAKSATAINRLFDAAQRLNGLGKGDGVKNSDAAQSGASLSGSASHSE